MEVGRVGAHRTSEKIRSSGEWRGVGVGGGRRRRQHRWIATRSSDRLERSAGPRSGLSVANGCHVAPRRDTSARRFLAPPPPPRPLFAALSFAPLASLGGRLFSRSTPVDRRIKEDAPVDSPGFKAPSVYPRETFTERRRRRRGKEGGKEREREREREREAGKEETESGSSRKRRRCGRSRVFREDTPPPLPPSLFTRQTVGSNSSCLVTTKSIPDSPCRGTVSSPPRLGVLLVPGGKYPRYCLPEGSPYLEEAPSELCLGRYVKYAEMLQAPSLRAIVKIANI